MRTQNSYRRHPPWSVAGSRGTRCEIPVVDPTGGLPPRLGSMTERSEIFPAKSAQTREYRTITGIDPRRSPTAFNACDWATRLTACPPVTRATLSPRRQATRQSKIASQHGGQPSPPGEQHVRPPWAESATPQTAERRDRPEHPRCVRGVPGVQSRHISEQTAVAARLAVPRSSRRCHRAGGSRAVLVSFIRRGASHSVCRGSRSR